MVFFNIITAISSFSIVPTTQFVSAFAYADSTSLNDNFNTMGYQGTAIVQNLNNVIYLILGYLPIAALVAYIDFMMQPDSK